MVVSKFQYKIRKFDDKLAKIVYKNGFMPKLVPPPKHICATPIRGLKGKVFPLQT